jgi:hypothetical protein
MHRESMGAVGSFAPLRMTATFDLTSTAVH